MMRWLSAALVLLCSSLAMSQNNRGPQGTQDDEFVQRGLMDLLYHRQDGVGNSDKTFFGDPNAGFATRGWRVYSQSGRYLDLDVFSTTATFNAVDLAFGVQWQLDSENTQFFARVDTDGSGTTSGTNDSTDPPTVISAQMALSGGTNPSSLWRIDEFPSNTVTLKFGPPGTWSGAWRPFVLAPAADNTYTYQFKNAENRTDFGRIEFQHGWFPIGLDNDLRQQMKVTAQLDPNSVNVRWTHYSQLRDDGTNPQIRTNVNRVWEVNQTKASRSIMQWLFQGTAQWTLDSSGNFVDNAGGNTVDGTDISSNGWVGAGKIANSVCTGIIFSRNCSYSTSSTRYCSFTNAPTGTAAVADSYTFDAPSTDLRFHSLRVELDTAPGSGDSYAYTLMRDATATALACTISNINTSCVDNADNINFTLFESPAIRVVPSGTPAIPGTTRITVCLGN